MLQQRVYSSTQLMEFLRKNPMLFVALNVI